MNDPIRQIEPTSPQTPRTSQSIEWFSEGQTRAVEIDGMQVTVRFVSRNGRRARIAIEAPAGAVFCCLESKGKNAAVAHGRID